MIEGRTVDWYADINMISLRIKISIIMQHISFPTINNVKYLTCLAYLLHYLMGCNIHK